MSGKSLSENTLKIKEVFYVLSVFSAFIYQNASLKQEFHDAIATMEKRWMLTDYKVAQLEKGHPNGFNYNSKPQSAIIPEETKIETTEYN